MAIKMNRNSSKQEFCWFSKHKCGMSWKKNIENWTFILSIRHARQMTLCHPWECHPLASKMADKIPNNKTRH